MYRPRKLRSYLTGNKIRALNFTVSNRGGAVGIATCCGLDGPVFESRGLQNFSLFNVRPEAHLDPSIMNARVLSKEKSGRCMTLVTHSYLVQRLRMSKSYTFAPLLCQSWQVFGWCAPSPTGWRHRRRILINHAVTISHCLNLFVKVTFIKINN